MKMFFRHSKKRPSVVIRTSWYKLTDRWWPSCFWMQVGLEAKKRRVTMRSPDKMAALIREMEQSYGEYLITCWPWVVDMQKRTQANG